MTVHVIKAITKRIRLRYGSTEAAGIAAGVSASVWSGYENADKPETTIPIGRLLDMSLTADERKAIGSLFTSAEGLDVQDVVDEAAEATEAAARVQGNLSARLSQLNQFRIDGDTALGTSITNLTARTANTEAPTPGPLSGESVKLLVKGDLLCVLRKCEDGPEGDHAISMIVEAINEALAALKSTAAKEGGE